MAFDSKKYFIHCAKVFLGCEFSPALDTYSMLWYFVGDDALQFGDIELKDDHLEFMPVKDQYYGPDICFIPCKAKPSERVLELTGMFNSVASRIAINATPEYYRIAIVISEGDLKGIYYFGFSPEGGEISIKHYNGAVLDCVNTISGELIAEKKDTWSIIDYDDEMLDGMGFIPSYDKKIVARGQYISNSGVTLHTFKNASYDAFARAIVSRFNEAGYQYKKV